MFITLQILAFFSVLGSLISSHSSDYWLIRIQNYFKVFYLFLNLALLVILITVNENDVVSFFLIIALSFAFLVCLFDVARYTFVAPIKVKNVENPQLEAQLSILVYNVLQKNDNYSGLISIVDENNPDIILLLETNSGWDNGTKELEESHSDVIKEIREDTYGLKFLSKKEIFEGKINKFVLEGVPSSEAVVKIGDRNVRIFGIHPKPPVPGEKLYSTSKDKEILRVGKRINATPHQEEKIVIGDFNDVAWSRISRKFKKLTGLQDPREGRGFYSTFPAYFPLKFPLDHIFLSDGFELVCFKTLPAHGSDHHPIFVKIQLKEIDQNTNERQIEGSSTMT